MGGHCSTWSTRETGPRRRRELADGCQRSEHDRVVTYLPEAGEQRQKMITNDKVFSRSEPLRTSCCRPPSSTSENTQTYEGINQIQRMVMARQLLK
jgi:hypothetical protein